MHLVMRQRVAQNNLRNGYVLLDLVQERPICIALAAPRLPV